jgi:hypothetical protein
LAVDGELDKDDGECGGGRGLLATCHANVAAVRLKQERWAAAEAACGVALTHLVNNNNRGGIATAVKVYFRRGSARERLSNPSLAAEDFLAGAAAAASLVDLAVENVRASGSLMQRRG